MCSASAAPRTEWPSARRSCFSIRKLAEDFDYRCKQAGQLASKMRFLCRALGRHARNRRVAAQCAHANACAEAAAAADVADCPGWRSCFRCKPMRCSFACSEAGLAALRNRGWRFYTFIGGGARFMFAWDSAPRRVDELAADIMQIASGGAA